MILPTFDERTRMLVVALCLIGSTQALAPGGQVSRAVAPGRSAPLLSISGRVVDSHGAVPRGFFLTVWREQAYDSFGSESAPISEDGTFLVRNLGPGPYVLEASPPVEWENQRLDFEGGMAVVSLEAKDLTGITITTHPGVTIAGTVRLERDQPGAPGPVVLVHAMLAVSGMLRSPSVAARAGDDGTFVLRNVYGRRVFRFGWMLPSDGTRWWPKAVLLDGEDVTNVPIDVEDRQNGRLEVIFTQRPTGISGTVVDEQGNSLARARTVVFSSSRALWHGWSTTTRVFRADAAGGIRFGVLPPGDYRAVAFPDTTYLSTSEVLSHLEELEPLATPVIVEDGQMTRVELTIRRPLLRSRN